LSPKIGGLVGGFQEICKPPLHPKKAHLEVLNWN